jgi:hypothetical protein
VQWNILRSVQLSAFLLRMREELAPPCAIRIVQTRCIHLIIFIFIISGFTGCHIPPLADPELVALLRATNENDVDNGLSSWIGRCCKRKRVRAAATAAAEAVPAEVGILLIALYPAKPQFKLCVVQRPPPLTQLLLHLSLTYGNLDRFLYQQTQRSLLMRVPRKRQLRCTVPI